MRRYSFILMILLVSVMGEASNPGRVTKPGYLELTLSSKSYIKTLPADLCENSALVIYDHLFWTINDSGGKNIIYAFDDKGSIRHQIVLKDVVNKDWEELAQDDKYLYVGDFGNNVGNRQDLAVYKINKEKITKNAIDEVVPEKIGFKYIHQNSFLQVPQGHAFDCEAMFAQRDFLYLFSKDWKSQMSSVYRLPRDVGFYELGPVKTWNVDGLVSGAGITQDGSCFALVGYKNFKPFLWLFKFNEADGFGDRAVKINLDAMDGAQTEGVCFLNNNTLLISCESTTAFPQQVFSVDVSEAITFLNQE